jgi:hypothetical protein
VPQVQKAPGTKRVKGKDGKSRPAKRQTEEQAGELLRLVAEGITSGKTLGCIGKALGVSKGTGRPGPPQPARFAANSRASGPSLSLVSAKRWPAES